MSIRSASRCEAYLSGMTSDPGFSDDDVARVFARASELDVQDADEPAAPGRSLTPSDESHGRLTLAELQAIGAEAGISADAIARAARELAVGAPAAGFVRRRAGIPVAVGQELRLDTPVSDAEWTRIVVRLRETFDARGELREQGAFREWSNGNLHASLEPTATGHTLRLRTKKGGAGEMLGMVGGLAGFAATLGVLGHFADKPKAFVIAAMMASIAVGIGGWQLVSLPRWAALRARQMRQVLQSVLTDRARRLEAPDVGAADDS